MTALSFGGAGPAVPGRLGILGGTFDPIHVGHLALAEEAREALGLERVLFVVAGDPWQKADRHLAPADLRLAMVEAAIGGNPALAASRLELDRPGPTYTVETLEALAAERQAAAGRLGGSPADLWFLLSADALAGLRGWHRPDRILELARLAVAPRVSDESPAPPVGRPTGQASGGRVPDDAGWSIAARFVADFPGRADRLVVLPGPRLGISSTGVRARLAVGRSIRYLVPDPVLAIIREYALYPPQPTPTPVPATQ